MTPEPWPADRDSAPNRHAGLKTGVLAQPEDGPLTRGLKRKNMGTVERDISLPPGGANGYDRQASGTITKAHASRYPEGLSKPV